MLKSEWRNSLPHAICLPYDAGDSFAKRVAEQAAQREAHAVPYPAYGSINNTLGA